MAGLEAQMVNTSVAMGLLSMAKSIYHLVGTTATNITKPSGCTTLVLYVESGTFRMQLGDTSGTIVATAPGASVTDGTGSFKLVQDAPLAITAPASFSARGSSASDILTYYWV